MPPPLVLPPPPFLPHMVVILFFERPELALCEGHRGNGKPKVLVKAYFFVGGFRFMGASSDRSNGGRTWGRARRRADRAS